ncbi:unnamed protein product [Calypogeia fissa]
MPVTSTGKQARTTRNDEGLQALWVRGYVGTTSSPVPADVNQEPDGRPIYYIHCIEWNANEPRAVVPQRRAEMCCTLCRPKRNLEMNPIVPDGHDLSGPFVHAGPMKPDLQNRHTNLLPCKERRAPVRFRDQLSR